MSISQNTTTSVTPPPPPSTTPSSSSANNNILNCYLLTTRATCEAATSSSNSQVQQQHRACEWFCPRTGASSTGCRCVERTPADDPVVILFGVIGGLLFILVIFLLFHMYMKKTVAEKHDLSGTNTKTPSSTKEETDRRKWYMEHSHRKGTRKATTSGGDKTDGDKSADKDTVKSWATPFARRPNPRYDTTSNPGHVTAIESAKTQLLAEKDKRNARGRYEPPKVVRATSVVTRRTFTPCISRNGSTAVSACPSPTATLSKKASTTVLAEVEQKITDKIENNNKPTKTIKISPPRRRVTSPNHSITITGPTPRASIIGADKAPALDLSAFSDLVFAANNNKNEYDLEQAREGSEALKQDTNKIVIPNLDELPTPKIPSSSDQQHHNRRRSSTIRWVSPNNNTQHPHQSFRLSPRHLLPRSPSHNNNTNANSSNTNHSRTYSGIVTLSSSSQSSSRASTPPGLSPLAAIHYRIDRDMKRREQQKLKDEARERKNLLGGTVATATSSSSSGNSSTVMASVIRSGDQRPSAAPATNDDDDQVDAMTPRTIKAMRNLRARSSTFPVPSSASQMKSFHHQVVYGSEWNYNLL